MIYCILLASLFIFSSSTSSPASSFFKSKKFWSSVVTISILFAFIPSTQEGVGTDYHSYIKIYNDDSYLNKYLTNGEIGSFLLIKVLKFFSDSPRLLFVAYGSLTSFLFSIFLVSINSIFKINRLYLVCFAFIVQSNLYHIQLSALRQILSVGFSSLFLLFMPLQVALPIKITIAFLAIITHNTGLVPVVLGVFIYFFSRHNQSSSNFTFLSIFRSKSFNSSDPTASAIRVSILTTALACVAASFFLFELIETIGSSLPILANQAWKFSTYYANMPTNTSSALRRIIYLPFLLYFCFRPSQTIQKKLSALSPVQLYYYFALSTLGYMLSFSSAINPALYRVSHMFAIFTILPTCIAVRYDSKNIFITLPALIALSLYSVKLYVGTEIFGYTPFF